jgi:transcriptional regulator with XRE-family HTH domain
MGLSQKQIRAAELLARGYSQSEAGKAVGASRRTVSRWLQQEDFRNLSYSMVGRTSPAPQQVPQQAPQRPPESRRQPSKLTAEDLVEDALTAIQSILIDPDTRVSDKIKAAALVGQWTGLGQPAQMLEMQALKILVETGWCSDEVLETLIDGSAELEKRMKNVLSQETGIKKTLLQESEEGVFDLDTDEFDEFDDE